MARAPQNRIKSNKVIQRESGRNKPKVKSACSTCKLRKVKCDEGRPSCNRCVSAGRICGGYGIWGGGGNARQPGSPSTSPESAVNPQPKVPISRNEARVPLRGTTAKSRSPESSIAMATSPGTTMAKDCTQLPPRADSLGAFEESGSPHSGAWILDSIPVSILEIPRTTPNGNLLCFFQEVTAGKLPGLFPSEFWNFLLPQAWHSEPSVFHGVLALTSAHKNELLQQETGQAPTEEEFALQAYSRAIRHLEPHFRLNNNASLRVTLMTCILFVCLELVWRRPAMAVSHLSNGLKLMAQYERSHDAISHKAYLNDHASDLIAQTFSKLSLQVNLLGYSYFPWDSIPKQQMTNIIPIRFFSMEEAREHLDVLLAQILQLIDRCREQELSPRANCTILEQQKVFKADLGLWLEVYTASGLETDPGILPRSKAAAVILRMYHTMANIMVEACQCPRRETVFDHQEPRFIVIMACAIRMWTVVTVWHASAAPQLPGDAKGSIIDIGWIPAVYFTAIKCRIRRIRLHAIRLLEATLHTEGVWDATAAARVAREVMRIEEGVEQTTDIDENFPLDSVPKQEELRPSTLPESRRVYDVEVTHLKKGQGRVEFTCRRRHDDDNWENIYREYDPISEEWVNKVHHVDNSG